MKISTKSCASIDLWWFTFVLKAGPASLHPGQCNQCNWSQFQISLFKRYTLGRTAYQPFPLCVLGWLVRLRITTLAPVLRLLLLFIDLHSRVIRFSFEQQDCSLHSRVIRFIFVISWIISIVRPSSSNFQGYTGGDQFDPFYYGWLLCFYLLMKDL